MAKKTRGPSELFDALFDAAVDKDVDRVREALAEGADPNFQSDDYDMTVLSAAVGPNGDEDVALALIEAGANPRQTDECGFTPLHYASYFGNVRVCEALLRVGADPNAISKARSPAFEGMGKGATPLAVADNPSVKKLFAGVTTVGLETSPFAKKLQRLREWHSRGADFEGGEPEVDALARFETEGYLTAIGQTGNGSVFALWSSKKAKEPKDGTVVYLDSEGEPCCAIAQSLDEFLSVLPYGAAWIHDAASARASQPKKALAAMAAELEKERNADGRPMLDGKRYATWWKATFGVSPAKDPASIVAVAKGRKPSFERWLSKKR